MRVIYVGEYRCPCIQKLEDLRSTDRTVIMNGAMVLCDCGGQWVFHWQVDDRKYWTRDLPGPPYHLTKYYV